MCLLTIYSLSMVLYICYTDTGNLDTTVSLKIFKDYGLDMRDTLRVFKVHKKSSINFLFNWFLILLSYLMTVKILVINVHVCNISSILSVDKPIVNNDTTSVTKHMLLRYCQFMSMKETNFYSKLSYYFDLQDIKSYGFLAGFYNFCNLSNFDIDTYDIQRDLDQYNYMDFFKHHLNYGVELIKNYDTSKIDFTNCTIDVHDYCALYILNQRHQNNTIIIHDTLNNDIQVKHYGIIQNNIPFNTMVETMVDDLEIEIRD